MAIFAGLGVNGGAIAGTVATCCAVAVGGAVYWYQPNSETAPQISESPQMSMPGDGLVLSSGADATGGQTTPTNATTSSTTTASAATTGTTAGSAATTNTVATANTVATTSNVATTNTAATASNVATANTAATASTVATASTAATASPTATTSNVATTNPAATPSNATPAPSTLVAASAGSEPLSQSTAGGLAATAIGGDSGLTIGGGGDLAVSATVIGDTVVASAQPETGIHLSTQPLAAPNVSGASGVVAVARPKFDLVRVDKYGGTVVAGTARPGNKVDIYLDGAVIAAVEADTRGGFVAMFDVPSSAEPRVITLSTRTQSGKVTRSSDQVMVIGQSVAQPEPVAEAAPKLPDNVNSEQVAPQVIIASDEGVKIVQPAAIATDVPDIMANVSLDLISYDEQGEVMLSGRSHTDRHIRVYVNGKPIKTQNVGADGTWQVSLPEVKAGRYVLRVDEIDANGKVTSRIETPFLKEQPQKVIRLASAAEPDSAISVSSPIHKITIQRGATLWALAKTNYGDGVLYMQIFNANRDFIRDPDLIYPGQIFTIPE